AAFCGPQWREVEQQVAELLARTPLYKKVDMMSGSSALPMNGMWPSPSLFMEGFGGFQMVDGPRGVSRFVGPATSFPVGMARGASWDPELEARVGAAIARETRAY